MIRSAVTLLATTVCLGAYAGETSQQGPSIAEALSLGYQVVGGGALGVETTRQVPPYGEVKLQEGNVYLMNGKDLLICRYFIVTENPAASGQDYNRPGSQCFRIK
jgi:hypothetical protein